MTKHTTAAVAFAQENSERFVEELKELLRIPSVSTAPEHVGDVRKAAEFVADGLRTAGLENVRLIETTSATHKGHPLVCADWLHAAGKPTVLLYGHYDVQPAEPLDEWKSPPFEPEVRDGNIYARGAVDDKGQMWMHVKALESLLKTEGTLPVNVRVIIEGEEEVGGEGIAAFVREHGDQLKADAALVSDTEMFAADLPTLCVGLRGMIYTELEAKGAATDLHSGMYGGAAPNPFVALAQMIAKMKREDGHIAIPGFYDGIEEPTKAELEAWRTLPFDEEEYRKHEVGSTELTGERMFSVLERTWSRPTMDVHGMPGGFIGAGAKTVIPAKAMAKISFRLVPGMKPEDVCEVQEVCGGDLSGGNSGEGDADSLGRTDCGEHGQRVCARGYGGDGRGVWQGDGVCSRGRVDPDCGGFCARVGHTDGDDGVWAAGRQSPCPE